MGTLLNPVVFAWIDDHFRFNAEGFQCVVKLVGPSDGHDAIDFAVDNERRCFAILNKSEWGVRFVLLPSAQGCIAQRNFKQFPPYVGSPPTQPGGPRALRAVQQP
jgi:hypothetical protein